jgi:urease accessory protein
LLLYALYHHHSSAHTGGLVEASLMTGLLHPLTGIDHLLVLMAVGLIAAKQGGRAWLHFHSLFWR